MSHTRCVRFVLVALLALVGASTASAEDAATLLGPRGQTALAAKDDAALKSLLDARTDVWTLCHELCLYGAPDVALALMRQAPPEQTKGLQAQIEAHRTLGARHDELREVWRALPALKQAKQPERILALLEAHAASSSAISQVRLRKERAYVHWITKQYEEAATLQDEVGAAAEKLGWSRRADASFGLAAQAWKRARASAKALASYRNAIRNADAYGRGKRAVEYVNQTTVLLTSLGRADELIVASKEVVRRYEALGDVRMVGWTQARLAAAYRKTGQLREAMAWIEKAVVNADKSGCPHCRGNAFNERGVVERLLGRFAEAVKSHEAAYELSKGAKIHHGMAVAKQRQGNAYYRMGAFQQALRAFEMARRHAQTALKRGKSSAQNAIEAARHGEAQVRSALGENDEALRLYRANLEAFEARGEVQGIAQTVTNISGLLRAFDPEGSLPYVRRSIVLKRKIKDRHGTARSLVILGGTLLTLERFEEALPPLDEAIALARTLMDPYSIATAGQVKGDTLAALGRLDEAAAVVHESLQAIADVPADNVRTGLMRSLSNVERLRGNLPEAIHAAREAVRLSTGILSGHGAEQGSGIRERYRGVYATGLEAAVAAGSAVDAAYFLETGRAGELREALQARDTLQDVLLPESLQQVLRSAREDETVASARLRSARAGGLRSLMRAARKAHEEAQRRLQSAVERVQAEAKQLAQIAYPKPDPLPVLQKSLVSGEVLLLYGLTLEDVVCLVVSRDGARIVPLGHHHPIHEMVGALRTDTEPYVHVEHIEAMRKMLVDPLKLDKAKRVLVSPVDAIGRVPFSLLLPQRDVAYVGSGTTYRMLEEQGHEHDKASRRAVLGIGDPAYPAGSRLPRLPASRKEVAAVADVKLLGDQATEVALRKALAREDAWCGLHFACHGLLDVDRPMFSSLALTPSATDDGRLTALDVFQLRVPAELVVLSACETAGGKLYAAEGVLGLTRAFTYAGAPRVISSLWKVDDQATSALMIEFYKLWDPGTGRGMSPGAALQQAQEYIRSQDRWKHPKFWAGWVLWGLPD